MTTALQEKECSTNNRDVNLDIYRGCIMIYITCFIHNIYGVTNAYSVVTSYFLIEMPLIFFVSGAAHSLARPRPYLPYLWGRVKRIVFPYYILVCFVTLYHLIVDCGVGGGSTCRFPIWLFAQRLLQHLYRQALRVQRPVVRSRISCRGGTVAGHGCSKKTPPAGVCLSVVGLCYRSDSHFPQRRTLLYDIYFCRSLLSEAVARKPLGCRCRIAPCYSLLRRQSQLRYGYAGQ